MGSQDKGTGFIDALEGSGSEPIFAATLEITLATEFCCFGSHNRLAAPLNKMKPIKLIAIIVINVERSIDFLSS